MAKQAYAGAMNTKVSFKDITPTINENGFNVVEETDIFGKPVWVNWKWQHGTEVFEAMKYQLGQTATITMYYSPKINHRCKVYLASEGDEAEPFEIVSIDAVEEKRRYMEIRLKREVKA